MKTLSQKLDQNKQKLGVIYSYNQHILNTGDIQDLKQLQQNSENSKVHQKKQSYAEKQQNISIIQMSKPIIEFDIQLSRNYSDKMIIFKDSVPEELVEEFIVYNHLKPQSFSPILQSVLEKMKQIEDDRDISFTNLRDDKYYEAIMKKQQKYCQELQIIKDMILREKQRGQQLLNMKISRINIQPERRDVAIQSPSQQERYEQKYFQSSLKRNERGLNQNSPFQGQDFLQNSFQQITQFHQTPPAQIESDLKLENKPFQFCNDNLNLQNQHDMNEFYNSHKNEQKQSNATPKLNITFENSKKIQKNISSTPSPPSNLLNRSKTHQQLKLKNNRDILEERSNSPVIQKSPLKSPEDEYFREKNNKSKNSYNNESEFIDPMEVSKRLYNSKKESPCPRHQPKQDISEKECTFKPQINENSRALSKIYNDKQNTKKKLGKENGVDQSQLHRSKSKRTNKNKNNHGNDVEDSQGDDTTIYQIVNSEQLKQSNLYQNKRIHEDFQEQYSFQTQPLFHSPQYKPVHEIQTSSLQYLNTSPRENSYNRLQQQFKYIPYKGNPPVYEKQINIKEEIIFQYPQNIFKPKSSSKNKQLQEQSIQTSEQLKYSNYELTNTSPTPFDPNLNKNYFKYLDMRDEIAKEQQENNEDVNIHHSFSKQQSQPQQFLKKSFGMQTSEQIQFSKFNKSSSIKISDMNTERQPVIFDPNLNKNYFKYLKMEEDIAKEKGQQSNFIPQYSLIIEQNVLPQYQKSLIPYPAVDKKTVSLQTSEYLMLLKSQQKSYEENNHDRNNSHDEIPKQNVPFDPNLNKNYFKFLQLEEEKQKEDDFLLLQTQYNGQNKNLSIQNSQQIQNHINKKKYEEEALKQSKQTSIQNSIANGRQLKSNNIQDNNDPQYIFKLDLQKGQVQQVKNFPEENNYAFQSSPQFHHESIPTKQQNQNITSNSSEKGKAEKGKDVNFEENGSVYYCDEDPITLQSDDPFITNSQKLKQIQQNNLTKNDNLKTNIPQSNFTQPKHSQKQQKPDINISSVRSVSPRIDKSSSNIQNQISPRNNFYKQ